MNLEEFLLILQIAILAINILLFTQKESLRLRERIRFSILFFLTNLIFYGLFKFQRNDIETFFYIKKVFFSEFTVFLSLLVFLFIFIISKKNLKLSSFIGLIFLSPYLYFLLFGVEKIGLFGISFYSLAVFQCYNPIIGIGLILPIFFKRLLYMRVVFIAILLFFLVFSFLDRKRLEDKMGANVYHRYIPAEFFFEGSRILQEEERGIYSFIRKIDIEEPIYRFSLKPIRRLSLGSREPIQQIISKLDFPIIFFENDVITVIDLLRENKGEYFQIKFILKEGKREILGPLF
ncbi:MAG: hypothetical protein SFU98_22355 [Leptospiraceae bacterium]|nr:hypothetical protein [Leptospiraceae bacterium]